MLTRKTIAFGATVLALGLSAVIAIAVSSGPSGAGAADHLDAPGPTPPGGDVRLDLTDVYLFRTGSGRTAVAMNVNGFTEAGKQATFATGVPSVASTKRVSYNLRVDNDGDAVEDVVFKVTFGRPNGRGVQKLQVRRNGTNLVRGKTSRFNRVVVNNNGRGSRVFAGVRDDPFFFDLDGFNGILSDEAGKSFLGCDSPRTDKFAGTNVSTIVLELKPSLLTSDGSTDIGVWATTNKDQAQIDRMGRPAIATVFIPSNPFEVKDSEPSQRDSFNRARPRNDQVQYRGEIVDSLETLFSLNDMSGDDPADDDGKISGLADILLPDVLTFDTSKSAGFLNGRRLADDVIDAELGLITEGAVTKDCVNNNDKAFAGAFPYLARPHR